MNDSCFSCLCSTISSYGNAILQWLKSINCSIDNIDLSSVTDIKRMLAHNNPMTVAAEYPAQVGDRYVVSTPVRFLDMLNTDMFVIFKIDVNNLHLPMYFKDAVNYEHAIVLTDSTPVYLDDLQLNGIYSAKYQYEGGYIILDSLIPLNPNIING